MILPESLLVIAELIITKVTICVIIIIFALLILIAIQMIEESELYMPNDYLNVKNNPLPHRTQKLKIRRPVL